MKKKMMILLSFAMLGLLAGCGGASKTEKQAEKDTLVFSQISEGKTLDPQDTTEQYSQRVITVIYDRLVEIDEMTGKIVPGLAKSWEQLDDRTILFHLNEGVLFHNGEKFTAEDVKFTLERAKKLPKVAHLYTLIDNIEVVDENTIKIHTSEPFAPLLAHLSHKTASIISKKYYEEKGDDGFYNPVGTGPYKYKDWKVGDRITLEANNNYFGHKPSIKYIVIRAIPEENSSVIGLETGEIDMTADLSAESRRLVLNNSELLYKENSGISVNYVGLNTAKGILKDKDVRRAIAMGINRDAIIKSILLDSVEKANSFIAPGTFGYTPEAKTLEYNPEEAKKIIKEKGLVGSKLTIGVSNSPIRMQMSEIIQAQLKEIGLDVTVESLEWGAFLTATGRGDLDMFSLAWGPSTYDGDYGYYPNFHSSQLGSAGNRSQYVNPEMDKLLDAAKKEIDVEKRKELYKQVANIIYTDVPVIPMYYANNTVASTKYVEGMKPTSYILFNELKFKVSDK
ncbi:Dipeptide-binding protein [Fusobacterium necrogenes]|uniref:Dipeptide-binding protein n=1 Tax=Fusobacterium necrogenes TaxID=858 RepID=A0A377GX24_9FUSO|nr:ABC transporter substrate-binding protein [Fusobacterium necrogenes]STO31164.1 Dipeptide-binding protein [Fusobacterium necrogenes]